MEKCRNFPEALLMLRQTKPGPDGGKLLQRHVAQAIDLGPTANWHVSNDENKKPIPLERWEKYKTVYPGELAHQPRPWIVGELSPPANYEDEPETTEEPPPVEEPETHDDDEDEDDNEHEIPAPSPPARGRRRTRGSWKAAVATATPQVTTTPPATATPQVTATTPAVATPEGTCPHCGRAAVTDAKKGLEEETTALFVVHIPVPQMQRGAPGLDALVRTMETLRYNYTCGSAADGNFFLKITEPGGGVKYEALAPVRKVTSEATQKLRSLVEERIEEHKRELQAATSALSAIEMASLHK
jgi:hypothetical protein